MEKENGLMSGKGEKGKWITVNGSHIFIEDGQSVEDAMNKKFSKSKVSDSERLRKILSERGQSEDEDFAKDTDYFGYGSLDELEKAHKANYKTKQSDESDSWEEGRFPGDETIDPDKAKSFVKGDGHLSEGGIEDKTDYSKLKPTEYKTQVQNLSKEAENWMNTTLKETVKKTPTESLKKIVSYWEEIYKVQNDAYSQKSLEIYGGELARRK